MCPTQQVQSVQLSVLLQTATIYDPRNPDRRMELRVLLDGGSQRSYMSIVEDVTTASEGSTPIHYLPHHAVICNDRETTKLCIVYDASAKQEGKPSLNDCLLVGPKFNQKILDILIRFCAHRIALTAPT